MKHVGLTGGMGSGKSTVCHIFELLGVPVYYSDQRAKYIMENDEEVIFKIKKLIGTQSYIDNKINRKEIAKQVFSNPQKLKALNGIVHPKVFVDYEQWSANQNAPYVLKESALLLDILHRQPVDQIIVVFSPLQIRIQRIILRDQLSKEEVSSRLASQRKDQEFIDQSDFIIVNDEKHALIPQVLNVHQELINFAKE